MEEDKEARAVEEQEHYPAWIGWTIVFFGILAIAGVCLVFTEMIIPAFRE